MRWRKHSCLPRRDSSRRLVSCALPQPRPLRRTASNIDNRIQQQPARGHQPSREAGQTRTKPLQYVVEVNFFATTERKGNIKKMLRDVFLLSLKLTYVTQLLFESKVLTLNILVPSQAGGWNSDSRLSCWKNW